MQHAGEGKMPSAGPSASQSASPNVSPARTRVVIVGAGFGGLGLAIKLKTSGADDFVILEKSASVGGVWNHNRYPGAACDVPSHLYSFSFEPRADWPQKFASQLEILKYLRQCVDKYALAPHIHFGAEVSEARWNGDTARWTVTTADGRIFETQALVTATGQLSRPFVPQLPGLKDFSGAAFHSADWPDRLDLSGKTVAVVGTGASAIQIVPAIAPLCAKLYVSQSALRRLRAAKARQKLLAARAFLVQELSRGAQIKPCVAVRAARGEGAGVCHLARRAADQTRRVLSSSQTRRC
jgi:cation diffusion facilitator CzcD-associated flavoprotein CzcO